MKKILCLILVLMMALPASVAFADTVDFDLTYDATAKAFTVAGETDSSSRVLLVVNKPNAAGIYYVAAKNAVSGAYTFNVKMSEDSAKSPAGKYQFVITENGKTSGVYECDFNWGSCTVKNLSINGSVSAGQTVTATVDVENYSLSDVAYRVAIALYKQDGTLVGVSTSDPNAVIESGKTGTFTAKLENLPEGISAETHYVKAFAFDSIASLKPLLNAVSTK